MMPSISQYPTSIPSSIPSVSPSTQSPSKSCSPNTRKIKVESTTSHNIMMFEVTVMSRGNNVALGKNATQSSDFVAPWNSKIFDASRAVDGKSRTYSRTDDSSSWWQVDLGGSFAIDSIDIKNRWCQDSSDPKSCLCNLSNATVSLLDEDDNVVTATSTYDTCGVQDVHLDLPAPCDLKCFPNARKIEIRQPSTAEPIHIFELHATDLTGVNVAQGKSATQSSTWVAPWNGKHFNASNAVDGKLWTYSRTDDANAWLQVDLGESFALKSLDILNRWCQDFSDPRNCLCKLSNATVSLMDDSGENLVSISVGDTCGRGSLQYNFDPALKFCTTQVSFVIVGMTVFF